MFRKMRWSPIAAVAVFLLAACGSPADAVDTAGPESVQEEQQATPTPKRAFSNLICENPAPEEIGLGSTIDSAIEDPVWTRCYWVEVPDGLDSVSFTLSGITGELDLAVGYGFLVTLQYNGGEFWASREAGSADEVIAIENPMPGPYFVKVGIAGGKVPSAFTLGVETEPERTAPLTHASIDDRGSCRSPATEIALGEPISSQVVARDAGPLPRAYFCVEIPDGLSSITVELSGLTGNLDLFVRHTLPAEWMDRSGAGEGRLVVIENPSPGPYYIDVAVGGLQGAGSPFTLEVRSP